MVFERSGINNHYSAVTGEKATFSNAVLPGFHKQNSIAHSVQFCSLESNRRSAGLGSRENCSLSACVIEGEEGHLNLMPPRNKPRAGEPRGTVGQAQ
ncbi:hypothetical protein SKAU_G00172450 [Synaphobranchus kaupii]|uniref:Uncharacterized protein n=1 Tax=Synaphobranchus kaupii TaxID=118154 RepID=A0A9Q1J0U6_SYNKA|nr:hypothetical protein SKAU_G00172450 [Synaphobranchus kaupii]